MIKDLSETSERIRSLTSLKEDINLNDIPRVIFFIYTQNVI